MKCLVLTVSFLVAGCTMSAIHDRPPVLPGAAFKPFLALPFAKGTLVTVSQGKRYHSDEIAFHPDVKLHSAVDFKALWGTPIYAPADGFCLASYETEDIDYQGGRSGSGAACSFIVGIRGPGFIRCMPTSADELLAFPLLTLH